MKGRSRPQARDLAQKPGSKFHELIHQVPPRSTRKPQPLKPTHGIPRTAQLAPVHPLSTFPELQSDPHQNEHLRALNALLPTLPRPTTRAARTGTVPDSNAKPLDSVPSRVPGHRGAPAAQAGPLHLRARRRLGGVSEPRYAFVYRTRDMAARRAAGG